MPVFARRLSLALLLTLLPALLAMGTGDSKGPTRIPEPQADFRVILTDQDGTRVELTMFAIEGQSFVLGEMGHGEAAVPFHKIKNVDFRNDGSRFLAKVHLKDGQSVEVALKPGLKATGRTGFGNYRIPIGEVRSIQVEGPAR